MFFFFFFFFFFSFVFCLIFYFRVWNLWVLLLTVSTMLRKPTQVFNSFPFFLPSFYLLSLQERHFLTSPLETTATKPTEISAAQTLATLVPFSLLLPSSSPFDLFLTLFFFFFFFFKLLMGGMLPLVWEDPFLKGC